MTTPSGTAPDARAAGLACSLGANLTWAAQPLFWPLLLPTPADELLAHRVLWSALTCVVAVLLIRRGRAVGRLLAQPRTAGLLAAAGLCLAAAWGVYIYAVNSGQVVQGSLGLFMIPLSTVLVGVVVFRERLSRGQWGALGLAAAATAVIAVTYGGLPWIALSLCVLMAGYAALKKAAAAPVLEGFTIECLAVAPLAIGLIGWLMIGDRHTIGQISGSHTALTVLSGLLTTVPLLLHAGAIRRLPLNVVGVAQYLNPTLQFAIAVVLLNEEVPAGRWIGFALIWVALLTFTLVSTSRRPLELRSTRSGNRSRSAP
ncbi:MAG TPA: EamA family transporter RarD [Jiangellaceae bacterium]